MTARSVRQENPVEHREPTPGTVRQLYGTAFACGKPGCHAELYKVNESTGRQVLNSRVAHIHARREGGPRWNPGMSEADNRDAMAALGDPIVNVPAGQVRVLVARLGAGKSEQASRWWEQGLQVAVDDADTDTEIPLFFTARQITSSLELAVVTELGGDPTRTCRVVIDDLDGVSAQEADRLLREARELVQVWPGVSVLATARPGIAVPDEEKIDVAPWPVGRGADLAEVAIGDHVPLHLWTTETADLLTTPLTALALAARVHAGRDTKVSRAQLSMVTGAAKYTLPIVLAVRAVCGWLGCSHLPASVRPLIEAPRPFGAMILRVGIGGLAPACRDYGLSRPRTPKSAALISERLPGRS